MLVRDPPFRREYITPNVVDYHLQFYLLRTMHSSHTQNSREDQMDVEYALAKLLRP